MVLVVGGPGVVGTGAYKDISHNGGGCHSTLRFRAGDRTAGANFLSDSVRENLTLSPPVGPQPAGLHLIG